MISIPAFYPSLPAEFAWIKSYDWKAENSFEGYKKLYATAQHLTIEYDTHRSIDTSCYALGRWFNRLLLELFDDEGEITAFVSQYVPTKIDAQDIKLFLAFLLGARRTVVSGMFAEGFDWELSEQTELTRRWPSAWYAQHLIRALDMNVKDMHIHTVPFFQDYNDGLSSYKSFFERCVQQIANIKSPQERAKMLLGIVVNRPITSVEKVSILHRVVDNGDDPRHMWDWVGYFLINEHLGNQAFCSGYEQLMRHLLSPNNPASGGSLAHPALPETMDALERLWEIEKNSPIPLLGIPELSRLGSIVLNVCTNNSRDIRFIESMQALEIYPWEIFKALMAREKNGQPGNCAVDLPVELC